MVLEKLKKFVEKLLKIVEKFEEGKVLYFGWSFSTVVLSLLGPVNRAKTIKDVWAILMHFVGFIEPEYAYFAALFMTLDSRHIWNFQILLYRQFCVTK